jgi:hypothetical protein
MLEITKNLRPNSLIPPYPNYHIGDYFEEFFFKKFSNEYPDLEINGFKYIPIFWTNCYTNKIFAGVNYNIQNIVDSFDKTKKYFTISQHDDCVYETLPIDTTIFSMGGNKKGSKIIPIPLICSPINKLKKEKNTKISFVGSLTHPIRNKVFDTFKNDSDFNFHLKKWELLSDKSDIQKFISITSESYYTLCPRGYGATSFRLYESLQLDSIPIYIFDTPWLPWENEIDWEKISILIDEKNIPNIKNIVEKKDYQSMIDYKNTIYNDYFTYEGSYNNIIKNLKKW